MPQSEPLSVLLVNESADEIKLATLSIRGFFPNSRVEAVYSLEEAFQWAHRASWHVILVDDRLHAQRMAPIFPELKRFAPFAAFVLQTERSDTSAALTALQDGADFLLYKKSPAFLTELVLYAKGVLETRTLRMTLERTQERHSRLIDTLPDVLYELDAAGRFVFLSHQATELLGYTQEELIGAPYSVVVPPDQLSHMRHWFNDRRTGARASRQIPVDLIRKASSDKPTPIRIKAELSAKGLYDSERRYFGTLGLLRVTSQRQRQGQPIQRPDDQPCETDRLLALAMRISSLSKKLRASHDTIHGHSQFLLKTLREAQLIEQVESIATSSAEAIQLGKELVLATEGIGVHRHTINDILDAVLSAGQPSLLKTDWIEQAYAPNLPPFMGNLDSMRQLFQILLAYALRYVAITGGCHRLKISTAAIGANVASIHEGTAPVPTTEFEIHIQETDTIARPDGCPLQTIGDLFEAYAIITRLGGRWEFLAPVGGRLSITVWIPAGSGNDPGSLPQSSPQMGSAVDTLTETLHTSTFQNPAPATQTTSLTSIQPVQPLPDRRKYIRTSVNLPMRLTIGNTLRQGTMTNLSPCGAALEVEGLLPSLEQQLVHLIFKTVAGSFELQAAAHDRGNTSETAGGKGQMSRLTLQFATLDENQQKVLASYIEEARARTLLLTVEALFSPMDISDAVTAASGDTRLRGTDHRETVRVRVSLPVLIEASSLQTVAGRPLGLVVNFSRGGACFQTSLPLGKIGEVVALHFSSNGVHAQPRAHEPEAPEAILDGRIIHVTPDDTVPKELKTSSSRPGLRIGIRFIRPVPFAEREVNRVIAQHIGSSLDFAGIDGRSSIISTRRECRNVRHQVIAVMDDHARHQISPGTPIVLIIPGFGATQTDYLPLSYYLAANHFRVLRYDHTNHVGQSDGDTLQITLRGMQVDLQSVLHFVHTTWPIASVSLLAEDIAARVALKVMARSKSAGQLFLLNPVLDIETALTTASWPDAIRGYRQNQRKGVANLWGLNVNVDQFIGDAIAGEFVDVASSAADFTRLLTQPVLLSSPKTNRPIAHMFGPQYQSVRAIGTLPVIMPLQADISRESGSYDESHTMAFQTLCKLISAPLHRGQISSQMQEPNVRDIYQQRQLEQERIRIRHHVSQATRDALSVAHLAQLPQLGSLPDYWTLVNELHRRLLPLEPGMTVLDIGCGLGDFVRAMLTDRIYQSAHQGGPPVVPLRYIGLEQSHESLKLAQQQIQAFAQELPGTVKGAVPVSRFVETHWIQTDWASPLPLIDESIHRILCHLSLSFAPSPLECLRQAFRVLHPEGTIVVTCFQPHTDLSALFQRHVRAAGHDESSSSAQIVLHFLGRLREAIRHGVLHTYERNELACVLSHSGAGSIQIYTVLDNQLLLAVVRKAKSTG